MAWSRKVFVESKRPGTAPSKPSKPPFEGFEGASVGNFSAAKPGFGRRATGCSPPWPWGSVPGELDPRRDPGLHVRLQPADASRAQRDLPWKLSGAYQRVDRAPGQSGAFQHGPEPEDGRSRLIDVVSHLEVSLNAVGDEDRHAGPGGSLRSDLRGAAMRSAPQYPNTRNSREVSDGTPRSTRRAKLRTRQRSCAVAVTPGAPREHVLTASGDAGEVLGVITFGECFCPARARRRTSTTRDDRTPLLFRAETSTACRGCTRCWPRARNANALPAELNR